MERERERERDLSHALQVSRRSSDEAVIVVLLWLDFREGLMRVSGFVARGGNSEKREMALKESAPLSLALSYPRDAKGRVRVSHLHGGIYQNVSAWNIDQTSISRSLLMLPPHRGPSAARRGQKSGSTGSKVACAPKSRDGTLKCSHRAFQGIYARPPPFGKDFKSPPQSITHFNTHLSV